MISEPNSTHARYIAVTGAIAAGKTTVADWISQLLPCSRVVEDFAANPFLPAFIREPEKHALETEITFLMLHYHQLRDALSDAGGDLVVADFYLGQDLWYAKLNLGDDEYALFADLWDHVCRKLPEPELVVVLHAGDDLIIHRVADRGRPFETVMSDEYVRSLNREVETGLSRLVGPPRLDMNMDRVDVASRPADRTTMLRRVEQALKGPPC